MRQYSNYFIEKCDECLSWIDGDDSVFNCITTKAGRTIYLFGANTAEYVQRKSENGDDMWLLLSRNTKHETSRMFL